MRFPFLSFSWFSNRIYRFVEYFLLVDKTNARKTRSPLFTKREILSCTCMKHSKGRIDEKCSNEIRYLIYLIGISIECTCLLSVLHEQILSLSWLLRFYPTIEYSSLNWRASRFTFLKSYALCLCQSFRSSFQHFPYNLKKYCVYWQVNVSLPQIQCYIDRFLLVGRRKVIQQCHAWRGRSPFCQKVGW